MTLVDRTIASLRTHHDQLAELLPTLDEAALTGQSGAAGWRVCDVLSHLGSSAELTLGPLAAAVAGTPAPQAANQEVWDRWNAMTPDDQARNLVEHDARVVETLEALDADARESLVVDLGFLPAPVPLAMAIGMRLNEVALHSWDVRVGLDPTAQVDHDAAELLLELFAGPLSMMMHWASKPEALPQPAVVALAGHGLSMGEGVTLVAEAPVAPTATFTGPVEAAVRLLAGRLSPASTPDGVEVTGNVTLDDLRRVFPGY